MEELKEEKITNKHNKTTDTSLPKINSENEIEESKNINGMDNYKELEMIKNSHIKKYTKFEIIKKSLLFSGKNLKNPIYNIIKKLFVQYIDLRIPIAYAKILNAIVKEINYDLLCSEFRSHSFLLFSKVIFSELSELFGLLFINKSILSYKRIILDNIGEKDIEFFDLYKTDEIMLSIVKNEHVLEYNFIFYAIETFLDVYNFFYLLFYLNTSSFTLTMLFFLVQGFKLLSDFLLTKLSSYKQRGRLAKIFNEYNSILYEFIDNIRLIKSMCIEDIHLNKLYPLKEAITHEYCTLESILDPCINFMNEVLDTFIVFVAGKYTIFDKINYSDLTIIQTYTNQLGTSYNALKNIQSNDVDLFNLWKEFFEIYDYENKVISLKNYIPENENKFKFNIEFKNVKFAYPVRPKAMVFNDLSLKIESGKKTAFVGYSGGGKSTLVALIQRLYDPLDGDIFLNNINLKDFNIKWLRQKIGFVSQDNILFSGTIKENIIFGLETYNEKHFKEICEMANLDFVYDKS